MRILQDGREITAVGFGEVEYGVKKEIRLEIENDGIGTLTELKFEAAPYIVIINPPVTIPPRSRAPLILTWTPSAEVTHPIPINLKITGKEVFRV